MSFNPFRPTLLRLKKSDYFWLLAMWAVVTAYNIFKPYHIDDTAHLEIARWIMGHPLHPMSGLLNWQGVDEPIFNTNQPHLYFYMLAIWGSVFGFSEPAMHALQALAALACILLFHRLAQTFAKTRPLWLTALLVLGPSLVVEQNLMVDLPLLAAWLVFFVALIDGVDSDRQTRRYLIAAVACAAAILIKYSSLVLLPILMISLAFERRRRQAWTVLVPIAAVGLWSAFNYFDYGAAHIVNRQVGAPDRKPLDFMMAWVTALGALTPLGVVAAALRFPRWAGTIYGSAALIFVAVVLAIASGAAPEKPANGLLLIGFIANSVSMWLMVAGAALTWVRRSFRLPFDRSAARMLYLLLWIFGTSLFYIFFAPFIAARHVLLIIPAILLVFGVRWSDRVDARARTFALSATVIVSVALCLSDWRFASFYRSEAQTLADAFRGQGVIWTSGHWGWQWYAERAGFRQVDVKSSKLAPGDLLIVPEDVDHAPLAAPVPLELIRSDTEPYPLLQLFCTGKTARFYTSDATHAPWSVSRDCVGHVDVFRVQPTKPPGAEDRGVPHP